MFIRSFQSEWLKTRRSLAVWLVVLGSIFIPIIMSIARLMYPDRMGQESSRPDFWETLFSHCWQPMALMLLPLGVILATSLIGQLEFKNNAWKQVHTTPQYLTTIFTAKSAVILVMLLQFFVLFNIGIYGAGVLPNLIRGMALPTQAFPFYYFLNKTAYFFLDCLPIVALQFLLSIHFKNFLVPLGVGIGLFVGCLIAAEWQYGFIFPYTYVPYNFFTLRGEEMSATQLVNTHLWAAAYALLITSMSLILYLTKKEKG
jgi:lantibiotic transport system permease protein